ncbi:MAG: hypothetical protein KC431_07405 [Myxococcales bacterium]|nr:hypothetical protein [Myxococcales bacterium]
MRPELEAALRRNPKDEASWAVFGDLLAGEGDSRGELIALEQRMASTERPFERQVLEHQALELSSRERRRWLGALADSGDVEVVWHRGFAVEATIHRRVPRNLGLLLASPTGALLHTLRLPRLESCKRLPTHLAGREILHLELRNPGSSDFSALASLASLRSLTIAQAQVEDLAAFATLPALETLALPYLQSPLTGLAAPGFPALRRLELPFHGAPRAAGDATLDPVAALARLVHLDLGHAGWTRVDALGGLAALETLVLCSTDVFDLRPLAGLASLRSLDLRGSTAVADLDPLAAISTLEHLRVGYTRVRSLRSLRPLPRLRHLDIAGTTIDDPQQLLALPALARLEIHGSSLQEVKTLIDRGIQVDGRPPPTQPTWRELAEGLLAGARKS